MPILSGDRLQKISHLSLPEDHVLIEIGQIVGKVNYSQEHENEFLFIKLLLIYLLNIFGFSGQSHLLFGTPAQLIHKKALGKQK